MAEREIKQWITVNGVHIPIYEGQSKAEAVAEYTKKRVDDDEDKKQKQIAQNKEEAEARKDNGSKEQKITELKKKLEEAKGFFAKNDIKNEIEMLQADWKGTKEEWKAKKRAEREAKEEQAKKEYKQKQEAEESAKKAKAEKQKQELEHELKTQPKDKVEKFKILQENNPMQDEYHVGIRKPSDIKTWKEAMQDEDSFAWGDFSKSDARKALETGTITIYSSYPIKQGVFVSTSKIQSEQYAGGKGKKVYSKIVSLEDVAWINGDEGQFAETRRKR